MTYTHNDPIPVIAKILYPPTHTSSSQVRPLVLPKPLLISLLSLASPYSAPGVTIGPSAGFFALRYHGSQYVIQLEHFLQRSI